MLWRSYVNNENLSFEKYDVLSFILFDYTYTLGFYSFIYIYIYTYIIYTWMYHIIYIYLRIYYIIYIYIIYVIIYIIYIWMYYIILTIIASFHDALFYKPSDVYSIRMEDQDFLWHVFTSWIIHASVRKCYIVFRTCSTLFFIINRFINN